MASTMLMAELNDPKNKKHTNAVSSPAVLINSCALRSLRRLLDELGAVEIDADLKALRQTWSCRIRPSVSF